MWSLKLKNVSEVLHEIEKCQNLQKYLQMIFDCNDIDARLSKEKTEFNQVDNVWKKLTDDIAKNNIVEKYASEDNLKILQEANQKYELVEKKLEQTLEDVR